MASINQSIATNRTAVRQSTTPVHWATIALAAMTGTIHLYLYTTEDWIPFLMAGIGFVVAVGLLFAQRRYRRLLYLGLGLFTLAQIVGYVMFPMGPVVIGVVDKAVQVALVIVLGYQLVADGTPRAESSEQQFEVARS